uniref:Uncharacterized protein n=1 Tax=Ditylenchus dipsaci TaxID=166011 RepID=A0A915EK72_9BILA
MKESAQEVLTQSKASEPLVREIAQNIEVLDDLWLELQSGATIRQQILVQCLQKAEPFWLEYEKCQNGWLA